jgi:hypothetical protein
LFIGHYGAVADRPTASDPGSANDPPALSSEYHKARRQLMLWAGILFAWELVGVDLEKAALGGGNVGAFVSSIKSPQAVPWIILLLVIYFGFRIWIEWLQCSRSRRSLLVAQVDFGLCLTIALLACLLYAWQRISEVQLADYFSTQEFLTMLSGFGLGLTVVIPLRHMPRTARTYVWPILFVASATWVIATTPDDLNLFITGLVVSFILSGIAIGIARFASWLTNTSMVGERKRVQTSAEPPAGSPN